MNAGPIPEGLRVFSCGNIEPHDPHEWCIGVSAIDHETPILMNCIGVLPPSAGLDALNGLIGERVQLVVKDYHGVDGPEAQVSIQRVTIRFESGRFLTIQVGLDAEFEHALSITDARF